MRERVKLITLLIFTICIGIVFTLIKNAPVGVDDVFDSLNKYRDAQELNNEMWQNRVEEANNKIETLSVDKFNAENRLKELQDRLRLAQISSSVNSRAGDPMTDALAYQIYTAAGINTNTKINKFFVEGPTTFTVTFIGTLEDINNLLSEVRENTEIWGLNIGNISIRQNFDIYDLKRAYDDETRLDWYDYKIVNAFGEVFDINEIEQLEEDLGIQYSILILNDVKFDTDGRDAELMVSNSLYEKKLSNALTDYANQLTILDGASYTDEVKEEMRDKLFEAYQETIDTLKSEKAQAANAIEAKYQQKYEEEKAQAVKAIETYGETVDTLRSLLADTTKIQYRLDITLKYQGS